MSANIPAPRNEPILNYAPGSAERAAIKAALKKMSGEVADIPLIIGGKEIRTGKTHDVVSPHDHRRVIAKVHVASPREVAMAIQAAERAYKDWSTWRFADRAAVFLRAAELLAIAAFVQFLMGDGAYALSPRPAPLATSRAA